MDSEALGRSRWIVESDLEAGLASPLLPPGPPADGHDEQQRGTSTSECEEEDVEQENHGQEEEEVGSNLVSRMRKVVHFWWSSSELTPWKPKLYISRLMFMLAFTGFVLLALCGALIFTYIVVMIVLIPRVVVVNYLVNPYMADSPDWGPSLIAFVSALILVALFIIDGWAERAYGKEWFGLCDWSDSWICAAAQIVLLYLFFETVYIALSTFILSFLTVSPKVASVGLMFVSSRPVNVLAVLLASGTVVILLAIVLYYTARKIEAAVARGDNQRQASSMELVAWNTLVFVDTVFRVILYIFLFVTTLCCIYFVVYGTYELCAFLVQHLTHAFHVHDLPDVVPFPSLN